MFSRLTSLPAIAFLLTAKASALELSPEHIDFFESSVRPLLIEHCYECHSAESRYIRAGLRLDDRTGILEGGSSGPAIVPGDPKASLLIRAITHVDPDLKMPYKAPRLDDRTIQVLKEWIAMGAPDPRERTKKSPESVDPKSHWAFQPVVKPAIPEVADESWPQNEIDRFTLARLEANGMQPSHRATPRTIARRIAYNLTGLPPTAEEVDAFERNNTEAFIDQRLASPHYGEHWGRFWLDIARYADTKGYVFEEERKYPFSFTYRDYVVSALNEDLPYDQFIIEQLAADLLPEADGDRLAAMGYLTIGRRFLNNRHDIIDDRIDVVTRGMMGLTVGCARCHDHKYDPVPIEDYYSLYGVFDSSHQPSELPLLAFDETSSDYLAFKKELAEKEKNARDYENEHKSAAIRSARIDTAKYLTTLVEEKLDSSSDLEALLRSKQLSPEIGRRWKTRVADAVEDPVLAPWHAAITGTPINQIRFDDAAGLDPLITAHFAESKPSSLEELETGYSAIFKETVERGDNSSREDLGDWTKIHSVLFADNAPPSLSSGEAMRLLAVPEQQTIRRNRREIESLHATHPGAPPRAMALADKKNPSDPRVFKRGNPRTPGDQVPRQMPSIVRSDRRPFENGSGRLEMAQSIASPDNPLTARVIVNRIWLQHFGSPLVTTPSDFGLRAQPPSHPELLDYLAAWFMENGWSLKKLHRLILKSATFQQSSIDTGRYAESDPDNRLLSRMNRRRLAFEPMRDTLLLASGQLDRTIGGRPVDIVDAPYSPRRTIYGFIDRQNLPGIFRTFDLASPDTTSPGRFETTVPQQALFMMNSGFVLEQATALAAEMSAQVGADQIDRINWLHRRLFQRHPSPDELRLADGFLTDETEAPAPASPLWEYGYGSLDIASGEIDFHPLPHFTGNAWQGGPKLPDPELGWVTLHSRGGHVGDDDAHLAIRRWNAPETGMVTIRSQLKHLSDKGDGVIAWVRSSRGGIFGTWKVHDRAEEVMLKDVEVGKGEVIDFVVGRNETHGWDSFEWIPRITLRPAGSGSSRQHSNAERDFRGPEEATQPLDAWTAYAHVLLMSNELVFVD